MQKIAPTLIIGVGGIGAEIAAILEKRSRVQKNNKNLEFLILDTDINAMREREYKGYSGERVKMSRNETVEHCVREMMPQIQDWYPNMSFYNFKSMSEGAGQVRAISRLALESCLKEGRLAEALGRLMVRLHSQLNRDEEQQMKILIISTLAGGTGSGAILPLVVYLRHYMKQHYPASEVNIKGFFLMPDILDEVVGGYREKISIYSNAYASLKELVAFMRKADQLADNSGELQIKLPMEGTEYLSEKNPKSYNYCFLIGKRNESNGNLVSFEEYKSLVADGVYMQALGPCQDIINSREDNLMKSLMVQVSENPDKGLPHFGGLGICKVIYPYEQIKTNMALRWALDVMLKDQAKYDKGYYRYRQELEERKNSGGIAEAKDFSKYFLDWIRDRKDTDSEAKSIYHCFRTDGQESEWNRYLDRLRQHMDRELERHNNHSALSQIERSIKNIKETSRPKQMVFEDNLRNITNNLQKYEKNSPEIIAQVGKSVESSVVYANGSMKGVTGCELESCFTNRLGEYCSLNEIRYFVYSLLETIKEEKEQKERFDSEWQGINEQVNKLAEMTGGNRLAYLEDLFKRFKSCMRDQIWMLILDRLELYLRDLCQGFEKYFEKYDAIISRMENALKENEKALESNKDVLVCSDPEERNWIFKTVQNSTNYIKVKGMAAQEVYRRILSVGNSWDTADWSTNLQKFWEESFEKYFGQEWKVDVLQALFKEAEILGREESYHAKETLKAARENGGRPFLRLYHSDNKHRIYSCCYSGELDEYDGLKKDIVEEELLRWNGRGTDEVDRYTIIYYQSFFGVGSDEIVELLHMMEPDRHYQDGAYYNGVYFNAYRYMTERMILDAEYLPVLTPHIDKHWHLLSWMGDIDPTYQRKWQQNQDEEFVLAQMMGIVKKSGSGKYKLEFMDDSGKVHQMEFLILKDAYRIFEMRKEIGRAVHRKYEDLLEADSVAKNRKFADSGLFGQACDNHIFERLLDYHLELPEKEYDRNCLTRYLAALDRICRRCAENYTVHSEDSMKELWDVYRIMDPDSKILRAKSGMISDEFEMKVYEDFYEQLELMGIKLKDK